MIFKARCQICGKSANIDTMKTPSSGWENYEITTLIDGLDKALDYEIWLCPTCILRDLSEIDEGTSDWEKLEERLIRVTKPDDSEKVKP